MFFKGTKNAAKQSSSGNVGSFRIGDTDAEATRTLACLSLYFNPGILQPRSKSERGRFLSSTNA